MGYSGTLWDILGHYGIFGLLLRELIRRDLFGKWRLLYGDEVMRALCLNIIKSNHMLFSENKQTLRTKLPIIWPP